jgi:plasmid stabilization system protein ParE
MQQGNYEFSWHHGVRKDILKIHTFIAQNVSIELANEVAKGIYESIESLRQNPERFPRERQLLHRQELYRYIRFRRYKILFIVEGLNVHILHVCPERQNPKKIRQKF